FSSKPFSVRKFIEIDRDEFDDVIRKITPEVVLNFDGDISLKLTFESLDDFHPDNLFQRVSLFSDLRKIRQNLKKADTFD
ncbi:type VI secretion system contractile sheath small subunit, partial [Rhizobium johnstonii]